MRIKSEKGFTLIETLTALAMLGALSVFVFASWKQSLFTQKKLTGRVTALILGRSKLAELELGSEPATSGVFPEPYAGYTWTAREETNETGITQIILTVEWRVGNATPNRTIIKGYPVTE